MSKLKTPQESPEYGKCSYLNLVTLQGGFLYIVRPSVLSFNNHKIHKTKAIKNICMGEKVIIRFAFNPKLESDNIASEQPGPVFNKFT